jgi:predicted adenine nucleotide alpha hydrolase (AANH) superfamily ATPase
MTTDNIKQKAREIVTNSDWFDRIDDRNCDFESTEDCLACIDTIIDQAIKERDEEIVEMIKSSIVEKEGMFWNGHNTALDNLAEDLTKSNK